MPDREIIADIEHLRKLFIFEDSEDKFIEFGSMMLDMLHSYFKDKGGIHSSISLNELEELFSDIDIPVEPHLLKDIFSEIKTKIIDHSVKVSNPYYIGHMTSAIPYFSIILEMIIAALNQNQVKIETAKASTFVERELISWVHRLIYNRDALFYKENVQNSNVALGNVTLDGTLANMTALLVARNKLFPKDENFPGLNEAGVYEAYTYYKIRKTVIFVSERGHYSIDKIADITGIGRGNVVKIPVDINNKIRIDILKEEISIIEKYNKENEYKIKILAIIGIAGTTETGNVDDLESLAEICRKRSIYFHVDAAWGGPVLFVKKYRYLFKGIESADSVTFDSHKLLYLPLSMGMVLFRDQNDLNWIRHTSTYILRPESRDQGRFTIEGSRPFSALRPWTAMKVMGSEGFRLLFENAFKLTEFFEDSLGLESEFELLNIPQLFIVNFRYVPKILKNILLDYDQLPIGEKDDISLLLNKINKDLHRLIRSEDNSFVSRTTLESTIYRPAQVICLRAIIINPLTTEEILTEVIEEHRILAGKIYKSYEMDIQSFVKNYRKSR